MQNIRTKIVYYYFDISAEGHSELYNKLKTRLKAEGLKCFETWGGGSHYSYELGKRGEETAHAVELETKHLFNNQWNTGETGPVQNKRVHDWAQDYPYGNLTNKNIKRGHYLVQNDEMSRIREETLKCGFCGHQHLKGDFCPDCIGSEYLEEKNLPLTRLKPVSFTGKREPLTEAELAERLSLYVTAQTEGATTRAGARIAKFRESITKDRDGAISKANVKHQGLTWLLDNNLGKIAQDNTIYYDHTGTWCFGWRSEGLSQVVARDLLPKLDGFPFPYEIKSNDGKTLKSRTN